MKELLKKKIEQVSEFFPYFWEDAEENVKIYELDNVLMITVNVERCIIEGIEGKHSHMYRFMRLLHLRVPVFYYNYFGNGIRFVIYDVNENMLLRIAVLIYYLLHTFVVLEAYSSFSGLIRQESEALYNSHIRYTKKSMYITFVNKVYIYEYDKKEIYEKSNPDNKISEQEGFLLEMLIKLYKNER